MTANGRRPLGCSLTASIASVAICPRRTMDAMSGREIVTSVVIATAARFVAVDGRRLTTALTSGTASTFIVRFG